MSLNKGSGMGYGNALYETSMDFEAGFHVLNFSPKKERPKLCYNLHLPPLYANVRLREKYKDSYLLLYIPLIYQEYFKALRISETKFCY